MSERHKSPPTIFISYSRDDKRTVTRLAKDLSADGYVVWFDDWSIFAGQSIVEEIQRGLSRADYFIFCVSPASLSSVWYNGGK